jgi:hypothetical protein
MAPCRFPTWLALICLLLWLGYEVVLRRRAESDPAPSGERDTDRGSTLLLVAYTGRLQLADPFGGAAVSRHLSR